jgi:hypothetical protein
MPSRSAKAAGASPLFPPECESKQEALQQIRAVLAKSPFERGYEQSRWTLELLRDKLKWTSSEAGMWGVLKRLGISWTRGRTFTESPDPDFDEKLAYLNRRTQQALQDPSSRLLYLDEMKYYRLPQEGRAWSQKTRQPTVTRKSEPYVKDKRQVLGAVDAQDGRLFYTHRETMPRTQFIDLYESICQAYPSADTIVVVQDNLPLHFHVDILSELAPQPYPWGFYKPDSWPDPTQAAQANGRLPVELVMFPTYSSWLNPIERLWRHLRRKVLTMHKMARRFGDLVSKVGDFLD